jgi:hypothetical protein
MRRERHTASATVRDAVIDRFYRRILGRTDRDPRTDAMNERVWDSSRTCLDGCSVRVVGYFCWLKRNIRKASRSAANLRVSLPGHEFVSPRCSRRRYTNRESGLRFAARCHGVAHDETHAAPGRRHVARDVNLTTRGRPRCSLNPCRMRAQRWVRDTRATRISLNRTTESGMSEARQRNRLPGLVFVVGAAGLEPATPSV